MYYIHMPTQKVENNSVRKLIKLGKGSLVVSLPAGVVNSLKWREKQKVVVKKIHGGVQIKDWKK